MKNTMLISFQYSATQPQRLFWKVAARRTFEKLPNIYMYTHIPEKNIHYSEIAWYWNVTTTRLIFGLVFGAFFPCIVCIIIFFGQKKSHQYIEAIIGKLFRALRLVSSIAQLILQVSAKTINDFTRDALIFFSFHFRITLLYTCLLTDRVVIKVVPAKYHYTSNTIK